MILDNTIRKIRLAILESAESATRGMARARHTTPSERVVYEQQLEQIAAMRAEIDKPTES